MTNENHHPVAGVTTLGQLARKLEHDSSAYTAQVAGMIITGFGIVSVFMLSEVGRNTTIPSALIAAGIVTYSIASRAAHRVAINRNTLTDRMRGAIADSDSIPGWAKDEVADEYVDRGYVPLATLTKIDLRIVEQRQTKPAMKNLTPGAARLISRYGKATDISGSIEPGAQ